MSEDGRTIGVWIGADDRLVEEFDAELAAKAGAQYSRSAKIKESMRLYLAVEQTLDQIDYQFSAEQSKRAFVRQALLDHARREQSGEE